LIGHFQIRNRGTIGGSIAHADPAAEYPAVVLALDATLEVLGTAGPRTVPATDFFTGLWDTAIDDDELLTSIAFPVWSGRCGFAIEEVARRHGDFAIAGAAVALELDDADTVVRCGIGLFGLASTPVRATAAEAEMVGRHVDELDVEELGRSTISDVVDVPSDLNSPPAYRRRVGEVTVTRALRSAMSEACGG
jgi:carbon-monoxide dehydrogenase medium subunit